jgi:hypothetical protein
MGRPDLEREQCANHQRIEQNAPLPPNGRMLAQLQRVGDAQEREHCAQNGIVSAVSIDQTSHTRHSMVRERDATHKTFHGQGEIGAPNKLFALCVEFGSVGACRQPSLYKLMIP